MDRFSFDKMLLSRGNFCYNIITCYRNIKEKKIIGTLVNAMRVGIKFRRKRFTWSMLEI